ncbi:MAG: GspH/FimT family pseudopilin [Gammaproteobacteria bacterium]|nr:GspH/FimT family pseudopilin [Gammaproteobacteria bacterium]
MPVQINGLPITVLKDPKEGSQVHVGRDIPFPLARQAIYRLMKKNHGFTLVELMITLAVVAILATVAVPSFMAFIQNNRITAQTNDLVTALNIARSEAIHRNSATTVCSSSDGATCVGSWDSGWLVRVGTTGTVLSVHEALSGGSTLAAPATVQFQPNAFLAGGGAVVMKLRPPGCATTGVQGRDITINLSGRVSVAAVTC